MPALERALVCPVCHGPLRYDDVEACCETCRLAYPRSGDSFNMIPASLPAEVAAQKDLWEQLQENGRQAYEAEPRGNLSVGFRQDAHAFGHFAGLAGRVLDVGCGPQRNPGYRIGRCDFYGIDPLRGASRRSFTFVQAVGECLPFADGFFDRVLFATTLDHLMAPVRALEEARRVLSPGGQVAIWFGEGQSDGADAARWSRRLARAARFVRHADFGGIGRMLWKTSPPPAPVVPTGAVDAFHLAHLTRESIEDWLAAAGFVVVDTVTVGAAAFVRAVSAGSARRD